MQALTGQLGGKLTMATDGGAKCIVDLPGIAAIAGIARTSADTGGLTESVRDDADEAIAS